MNQHARREEADGVLTVTLDRDAKLNAIDSGMTAVLAGAVADLRDRDDLAVLVIQAEGRYFSAGIDLESFTGGGGEVDPADPARGATYRRRLREHHLLYDEMEAVEKPVVLAAQGPCLGAGLEMAVSCDFRLAAESASFGLPEVRLGVIAGSGGVSRLTRLVGPGWARWIAMADRQVDASRALTMGLVQEVLPDEGFHDAVAAFARALAGLPREAVGVSKLAIEASASTDRATARDFERLANTTLNFAPAFQERLTAFRARNSSRTAGDGSQ